MSKYLDLKANIDDSKIKEAAEIIKNGGLVVFPTETVYGIAANGLDAEAAQKIYLAKERQQDKPLILLISNREMLDLIVEDISPVEAKLIEAFWPGPLTLILNRKSCVPDIITSGQETVGVRMTSGKIAQRLIEECGFPITAPSANISGKPSGTNPGDIFQNFKNKVDCIIDGGNSDNETPSTIVRVIDEVPHILRERKDNFRRNRRSDKV